MKKKLSVFFGVGMIALGAVILIRDTGRAAPASPFPSPSAAIITVTPYAVMKEVSMKLDSTAFADKGTIPKEYTCDGSDSPPPLSVSGIPPETVTLALTVDDPDAPNGTWIHWLIWNLPPDTVNITYPLPQGAVEGTTSFGKPGYGGPCPPSGMHRYYFRLYALDIPLTLGPEADRAALDSAMSGHIIGNTELMGTYSK